MGQLPLREVPQPATLTVGAVNQRPVVSEVGQSLGLDWPLSIPTTPAGWEFHELVKLFL